MTSRPYAWLPDHHLAVAATLAHADEVIAEVADILFDYQRQPDGIIGLREVFRGTYSQTIVTALAPIPRKVPLLVADALVALRNALEHTLFAEVEHRDGALSGKAAGLVGMPAATRYAEFDAWVKSRTKNGSRALLRGSELLKRIETLQPFHRTKDPENHPLALLALHTNHSKHRAPAITAVRLAAMYREDQLPRSLRELERRPEVPLQVGEVIAWTPIGTRIPVSLIPTIGINRPGTDRWPVLMKELDGLATWVRTQAVPRLITGIDPPVPALPAKYEISLGHVDERSALLEGSTVTAAQLNSERFGAASARRGMVETIGQMDGAPSAQQIAAWLESLTDQEVIRKMGQFRLTDNSYGPDVVLRRYELLVAMRDDARRFAVPEAPVGDEERE